MCIILLNMISMMMNHHDAPEEVTVAIKYLNYLFTTIFTLEAIVRLIAMRLEYFKSGMNVFDFITVVFSIAGEYCILYDACCFKIKCFINSFVLVSKPVIYGIQPVILPHIHLLPTYINI